MFSDMGQVPTTALAAELLAASTAALSEWLKNKSYVGWLALDEVGQVIAGAGAQVTLHLPRVSHDGSHIAGGPVPLVVNVYTDPKWRRLGIARALMKELMDWASARGCDRVVLHASDAGRDLYESLGFVRTNEMRWTPSLRAGR